MATEAFSYVGSELELFARAVRWKRYYRSLLAPRLGAEILEVGAGIGETAAHLCSDRQTRWVCLEPDPEQAALVRAKIESGGLPAQCSSAVGTLADVDRAERFDSVLYVDVLEHIEDDRSELARAAEHLRPGGSLVVLSPAHQWLFSEFDRAVGHFRRYSRSELLDLTPAGLRVEACYYLDSCGLFASIGNRYVLRKGMPTASAIAFWDGVLVRASTRLDPLLRYGFGKTVVAVWRTER